MKINFLEKITNKNIVIGLFDDLKQKEQFLTDKELNLYIKNFIKVSDFKGKLEESIATFIPNRSHTIIIIGMGKKTDFTELNAIKFGSKVLSVLKNNKISEASIIMPEQAANIAYGAALKNYQFNKYKSKENLKKQHVISNINFITNSSANDKKLYNKLEKIVEAVHFARNIITEPPNVIYPETLANEVKSNLTKSGVKVEIFEEKHIRKLGMNAMLGVAQGSIRKPKLVVMHYQGGKKSDKPIAFIGKGVTFDSGGLSIKLANMETMKYDMSGSAVVAAVMKILASRKAKINAIGVVGYVENMIDGNSQRPSDVVKTMSGQTVEILNTDAEGRLLLCDLLWYCQDRFKPKLMIDIATLTSAVTFALGSHYAGLFTEDDKLAEQITNSANKVGERLWRLPLDPAYNNEIKSEIADLRNISFLPRPAGSTIAAQFLQHFINKTPWIHIDMASVGWERDDSNPFHPKGATAFGIRLLNQFVEDYCEKNT